jgi:hypothetical protein
MVLSIPLDQDCLGEPGDGRLTNASKHKAMSYERMVKRAAELEAEVASWREAAAADPSEDAAFGRRLIAARFEGASPRQAPLCQRWEETLDGV